MSLNVTNGAGQGERTSVASGYLLGIDVGTTRTAAATCRSGPRHADTEIVNLGDRSSAVPSVLFVADDGSFVVGEAAERRATSDPGHIVREFKRRIGDPTPLLVGGRPWAPEDLSALLVQWVVDRVAQREGGPAARIAVTHPASWGGHKKDLLAGALHHHGLPATFLAEPQAAALHYAAAERVEPGSTIAVYDFGGGTFDAAVVHKEPQGFSLLGRPEGVERLGGIDLDELVFEHVREGLPEAFEGLDETDPAVLSAVAAVRRECTEAKQALSADTEVSIPVLTPAGQGSVRLHRSEFEAMIQPRVEETVSALRRAISSAALTPEQLTAVLLVGGSSRIPLVAQLVSEHLGRPVAVDADPKNAIAKGAALSLTPAGISATGAHLPVQRSGTFGPSAPVTVPVALLTPSGRTGPQSATQLPTSQWQTGAFATEAEPVAPTQRISTARPQMAPPRPPLPDWRAQDAEFTYAPQAARRSSPAVLVGAGGAGAAVLVLAAAFLWPRAETPTVAALDSSPSVVATTTATAPTTVTVEPTTEAAPPPKPVVQRTQPRIIVLPPVTKTEAPPTTTPAPPPPTTTAKTTPTTTTTTTAVTPPPTPTTPTK
ncbi:MAG: molecular chaperone DnaK [Pseudonocardiales bacterium]|nr:molecular chaperone DnaK [Pseudonocardiales bacterium]